MNDIHFSAANGDRVSTGALKKGQKLVRRGLNRIRTMGRDLYARISWHREIEYRAPDGFRMYLDLTKVVDRCFFVYGFEENNLRYFKSVLTEGMVVFDVGANIGIYTLTASRLLGSQGQVHAFEPASWAFKQLERNIRLNDASNVVLNNIGVSDSTGEASFNVCEDDAYNSLAAKPMQSIVATKIIKTITLDEYVDRFRIRCVDVIKVDTEGADFLVLKGAERLLRQFSPVVFFEYNRRVEGFSFSLVGLENFMHELGYELFCSQQGQLVKFNREVCDESELIGTKMPMIPFGQRAD